jgi:hypothetical protein
VFTGGDCAAALQYVINTLDTPGHQSIANNNAKGQNEESPHLDKSSNDARNELRKSLQRDHIAVTSLIPDLDLALP